MKYYTPEKTETERIYKMSDSSCGRRRVAGYNQFSKLLRRGKALKVYLANDADVSFTERILRELESHKEVVLDRSYGSDDLAAMVNVEVPTAVITETEQ